MSSTIIESMKEVYEYRRLLYSMVVRNLKGEYKSSYLGFAWHFITPAIMVILFYVVFTALRGGVIENYWVYLCIGMFPFTFFQTNLGGGSNCVVSNAGTIKKMYFPREIIVLSRIISTFITFLLAYVAVIALMLLSGITIGLGAVIFLPAVMVLSIIFATGYVLLLSSITVFVRDVHHFLEAISRIFLWTTPIFYLASEVSGILETIIWSNPLTYFIESYHDILYLGVAPSMFQLGVCLILAVVTLVAGAVVFNRLKGKFAEVL